MPIQNPLSIPGGWKKDTPRDTPAAEEPNPGKLMSIPLPRRLLSSIIDHLVSIPAPFSPS